MFEIATFYRFIKLTDLDLKRDRLKQAMRDKGIKGTIILAEEGFNSTICGAPANLKTFVAEAEEILQCTIETKSSFHEQLPFRKLDVKIKPEIVTLKQDVDIAKGNGTHVEPKDWNEIISDPDTIVLDARNHYEVMNGRFVGAIDPNTTKFSELPGFIEENLDPGKKKRVAMYCTGGIRCEKFAPYLRSKGFENVVQLRGGILKYLETVNVNESLWQGECFVFDDRRTVDSELKKGVQPDHSLANKK
ncbi:MAG: rhodanese-related sulfurtransferase [Pyrinomonadaceae bacterium]